MKQELLQTLKTLVLALLLSVGVSYVYAWTGPTAAAPNGNTAAPLNTSANDQVKAGGLTVGALRVDGATPLFRSFNTSASTGLRGWQIQNNNSLYFGTTDDSFNWQNSNILVLQRGGNVGIGTASPGYTLQVNGSLAATYKNFVISDPLDPQNKLLVHSSLEGPEHAVYYRGKAQLANGNAVIELPAYFEALTREENRAVLLTNIDGFDQLAVKSQDGREVKNGAFVVYSSNQRSSQKFNWEVKAVRADVPVLVPERLK